ADGWAEQFIAPLLDPKSVLRTGIRARAPARRWHHRGRVALLGDAAHPLVSYIGQGAMMAVEDVGVLVRLLAGMCLQRRPEAVDAAVIGNGDGDLLAAAADAVAAGEAFFDVTRVGDAFRAYEKLRIPRTRSIAEDSTTLGRMLLERTLHPTSQAVADDERRLADEVSRHGTLRMLVAGAAYDYAADTARALAGLRAVDAH
ncbi:hypothetical protein HK405_001127, partial [Cladochytrium tenue]